MTDLERRLRLANEAFQKRDKKLAEEVRAMAEEAEPIFESLPGGQAPPPADSMTLETIVRRTGRPVLAVFRDEPKLEFSDAESTVWRERLTRAKTQIVHAVRAVGRIELENNQDFEWVGTGWLVDADIVVTNRHVAKVFARQGNSGFVFRPGAGGLPMVASIDFIEEFGRQESLAFGLNRVLHIEPDGGPDLAFFKVTPSNGARLAERIELFGNAVAQDADVAVIGYPARDSRIPDQALMLSIFGDVYDKKRLAPGKVTRSVEASLEHDCSTLGGNSGSLILDLDSGKAVGLHFAGRFLETNFAVPAALVADRLKRVTQGGPGVPGVPRPVRDAVARPLAADLQIPAGMAEGHTLNVTIPLNITISVGTPVYRTGGQAIQPARAIAVAKQDDDGEEILDTEGVPADYSNRQGYDAGFLGAGADVPLPDITRNADQIVAFEFNGQTGHVLHYNHYSVVMNRDRRMCFFSAVNINGLESRRTARAGWRNDPRIPAGLQISRECYGNPPKFSRGHMTRREDPAWGSPGDAELGNTDSMHFTNSTPQMQTFNGGIWLELENYALQNARKDQMRISVITGPVLAPEDPLKFGVRIPVIFWKVIAFIHDTAGELSATGYSISQEEFLSENEFVFGRHKTHQRPLQWIEQTAGVSFGSLTAADRFEQDEEAVAAPLGRLSEIRFF